MKHNYVGFNSYEFPLTGSFTQTDIELVKSDLLNHIYTIRGERVMMPKFGTRIPTLAFEPLDQLTLDILEEDLLYVVNYDPRVKLINLYIDPDYDNNSVIATLIVLYIEFNVPIELSLNIEFEASI
jgi:phage baseplate assembly protein W